MRHELGTMRLRLAAAVVLVGGLAVQTCLASAASLPRQDPLVGQQWGLSMVHAQTAWRTSTGRGVVVAVVDSGIDLGHPDLRGQLVRGFNAVSPGKPPQDDFGHGTHVAGVIAAGSNGRGIVGVAPGARLMPVKVLDAQGSGTSDQVATGVRYAADHGARVINLSLGQDPGLGELNTLQGANDALHAALDYAWRKGAVLVVSAGNSAVPVCSEPASSAHVVCVGAVGPTGAHPWYSQGDVAGTKQMVCAPGGDGTPQPLASTDGVGVGTADDSSENVLSTVARGTELDTRRSGYVAMAGTSMAAPHVSGIAALLAARGLSNAQIVARLLGTAVPLSAPGSAQLCGRGLVDAARALRG